MPKIRINRAHSLSVAKAKQSVDKVAEGIKDRFQINAEWKGNTLEFSRSGVSGTIAVDKDSVAVNADISFLLTPIKSAIETEIKRYFDQEFGC